MYIYLFYTNKYILQNNEFFVNLILNMILTKKKQLKFLVADWNAKF